MPSNVEKVFIRELVEGITNIQTDDKLITPSMDSIIAGLNRDSSFKEHLGKRIFILGASNMEALKKYIGDLCKNTGVEVVYLCEGGDFLKFFLDNPALLEVLKNGTSHDILFINPVSNNVITYKEKEKKQGAWHLKSPAVISDQKFNELMVDVNHAVSLIHSVFTGRCVLMGPYPRMLRDCCMDESHWLRDDNIHRIDMLLFTDIVTDHMYRATSLPDNWGFASYKDVFGRHKFNVSMLTDNVHLDPIAQNIVSSYMLGWLDKDTAITGKAAEGEGLIPLSEALSQGGIYTEPDRLEDDVFDNGSSARTALSSISANKPSKEDRAKARALREKEKEKERRKQLAAAKEKAKDNPAMSTTE